MTDSILRSYQHHTVTTMVPFPAPVPFAPSDLTGLIAWYDAASASTIFSDAGVTLATDGSLVQQWNDKSGNGYHQSQATSGSRPTYQTAGLNSLPTVTFLADFMQSAAQAVDMGSSSPQWSCFVAGTHGDGAAGGGGFTLASYYSNALGTGSDFNQAAACRFLCKSGDNVMGMTYSNNPHCPVNASGDGFRRFLGTYNGTDIVVYVDNATPSTETFGMTLTQTATLALGVAQAFNSGGSLPLSSGTAATVYMQEVLLYNRALNSTERGQVDTYLADKWL